VPFLQMTQSWSAARALPRLIVLLAAVSLSAGCGLFRTKSKIAVPSKLTPLAVADTRQLLEEINRQAGVQALNGKVDLTFLDTSFASCGLADLYREVEGRVVVQRPGHVYVLVQAPLGIKIAEMSSDGRRFWAAVYQGDERYKRFVTGTNTAEYERLEANGPSPDCTGDGKRREQAVQRATVTALSSMRPQHFTDALLVPPAEGSGLLYAQSESFEEEEDTRRGAKKGARVVRGYYVLAEIDPSGDGPGRARILRRFWFDRVGQSPRLARVQSYNPRGELITDVRYGTPQGFGGEGAPRPVLPSQIELTRPQESYALRITFQDPGSVKVDQPLPPDAFVLKNSSDLKEVDLDARKK